MFQIIFCNGGNNMGKLTSAERKILEKFFRENSEEVVELLEEILERGKQRYSSLERNEVQEVISNFLTEIGMPKNIRGFEYLCYSIYLIIKYDKKSFMITKEVYPRVAEEYSVKPSNVERCIRTAVKNTFVKGCTNKRMKVIFKKNPTPSEFVAIATDEIKKRLQ